MLGLSRAPCASSGVQEVAFGRLLYFYLSQRRICFLDLQRQKKLDTQIRASRVQDSSRSCCWSNQLQLEINASTICPNEGPKLDPFFLPGSADDAQRLGPEVKVSSNNTNKDSLSVQTVQKRETNTRQPANPPARFAFRHTRNSRATADRAQSPNKQPHTKSHIGREIKKNRLCHSKNMQYR